MKKKTTRISKIAILILCFYLQYKKQYTIYKYKKVECIIKNFKKLLIHSLISLQVTKYSMPGSYVNCIRLFVFALYRLMLSIVKYIARNIPLSTGALPQSRHVLQQYHTSSTLKKCTIVIRPFKINYKLMSCNKTLT